MADLKLRGASCCLPELQFISLALAHNKLKFRKSVCVPLHVLTQPHALRRNLLKTQLRLKSLSPKGMSTRGRGRAGYVPRPHAPTPHASTKSVRSSTQSTPGPHASIKSVRSSTLHPFTSESVHEVTSQVSHSDTSSTHCNTDGLEAEEQRRINEELVGRIQILESDRTEYNAKVDFLMQQISRRVLQACVDLKLGSSLLDFECHFNETIEKKM
ncbi:unnamed protein product [Camellia sinensis]